jgi:hypothetical protein
MTCLFLKKPFSSGAYLTFKNVLNGFLPTLNVVMAGYNPHGSRMAQTK